LKDRDKEISRYW